jgi:hypothetical protein
MELAVGSRWRSVVSTVEVIVVVPPAGAPAELRCGGRPMVDVASPVDGGSEPAGAEGAGPLLGKRYLEADSQLEVLCTRPGDGALAVGERPMELKAARPLPASD